MVDLDARPALTELRIAHDVFVVVDGAGGEPDVLQELRGGVRRTLRGPRGDRVGEFAAPGIELRVVVDDGRSGRSSTSHNVDQSRQVLELDRDPAVDDPGIGTRP